MAEAEPRDPFVSVKLADGGTEVTLNGHSHELQ